VETTDLFLTVRLVTRMLQRVIPESTAFNVAVQDGEDAGQSVRHVHAHIIPRRRGDMKSVDDVYKEMNGPGGNIGEGLKNKEEETNRMQVDDDDRKDRSEAEMVEEATWFAREMQRELDLEKSRRE
jgi:bis(5'-adenosyl)-triphosphatase